MEVYIGPEIVRSYKRLSYTVWHALAEFIDNSIQSYRAGRAASDAADTEPPEQLAVEITYRRARGGLLTIRDNAIGMSEEELANALRIGQPPQDRSGLSEFGLGMKTAACWFGDRWTVSTKGAGSEIGRKITFDVEEVASHRLDLQEEEFEAPAEQHFTEITITNLHHEFQGGQINQIKTYLRSMYRTYIESGDLVLTFNRDRLAWRSPREGNTHTEGGRESFERFAFEINGKAVSGWLAVLERGSRANAGLTIIRRGRVIKGWPNSWRPQSIFGQPEGSNDLVNQRLIGEINMDSFGVSHTKDDILWESNDQTLLENELADVAESLIDIATSYRKRGTRGTRPSMTTINSAKDVLEEEIRSSQFRSVISANGSTPRESYRTFANSTIQTVTTTAPDIERAVAGMTLKIFLAGHLSDKDPYVGIGELGADSVSIVINMNHPHIDDLNGRMGVLNHLKACTYEGVAEWKVRAAWDTDTDDPAVIRAIKDSLLRVGPFMAEAR